MNSAQKLKFQMQQKVLEQHLERRNSIFDFDKLRRTMIAGLDCKFLSFI